MGPVEDHQRPRCRHLEASRQLDRPKALLHHLVAEGGADERLRRRQCRSRVVSLVVAVERQEHLVVAAVRTEEVEHLAPDGGPGRRHPEVLVTLVERFGGLGEEEVAHVDGGLPQHQRSTRTNDAGLLTGDGPPPVTDAVGVVPADVRHHRHL